MGNNEKPRILLVENNDDASAVLAGTLYLKGCQVHKTNGPEGCLKIMTELSSKVDVVILSYEAIGNKDMDLIISIKKINFDTKILVIANENVNKNNILDFGADEFALKPMSPENVADKVLMLIAKEASIANKDR